MKRAVLHSGLRLTCKVCNPDYKPARRDRFEHKVKRTSGILPVEIAVKRQVSVEIDEEDVPREQRYILLQKYGVVDARIDRRVTKPSWMSVAEWTQKLQTWFKLTKGLVPSAQPRKSYDNLQNTRVRSNRYPRQGHVQVPLSTTVETQARQSSQKDQSKIRYPIRDNRRG